MQLQNKTVVVIGGFGTIGKEITLRLLVEGASVIVAEKKSVKQAPAWFHEAERHGRTLTCAELDITSRLSIEMFLADCDSRGLTLDCMVNSAYPRNPHYGRKLDDVTYEDFCENVSLHLGGYFLATQVFAEYFKQHGKGSIVNLSSIYGVVAPRFEVYSGTTMTMPVEYAAIKSALIHLTKYFSRFYQGTSLRFNCVSPGGILADQPRPFLDKYKSFSLEKGMLEGQDIVGGVVFLLSDQALFVKGQNLVIDDGWSL